MQSAVREEPADASVPVRAGIVSEAAGTPMQPAGVLYVPGRCDMVKLKPGEDPAQADAERQKDLPPQGAASERRSGPARDGSV